jgi:hypothetical protein
MPRQDGDEPRGEVTRDRLGSASGIRWFRRRRKKRTSGGTRAGKPCSLWRSRRSPSRSGTAVEITLTQRARRSSSSSGHTDSVSANCPMRFNANVISSRRPVTVREGTSQRRRARGGPGRSSRREGSGRAKFAATVEWSRAMNATQSWPASRRSPPRPRRHVRGLSPNEHCAPFLASGRAVRSRYRSWPPSRARICFVGPCLPSRVSRTDVRSHRTVPYRHGRDDIPALAAALPRERPQ